MVKSLTDLTFECLIRHFSRFSDVRLDLPPAYKQILLHRIIDHDLLNKQLMPAITYNLVSPHLTCLNVENSLQLDDSLLMHIGLMRCQLTTISLASCGRITDEGLTELFICQTSLTCLNLKSLKIDGSCLRHLDCPWTLTRLSLKGCAGLDTKHAVQCIARHRNISHINLRRVRAIKDEDMMCIAQSVNTKLCTLVISLCSNVSDESLLALADYCPNLETLKLMECMNCSDSAIEHMLFACNRIKKLDLSYCSRYDQSFLTEAVFASLPPNLECLKMRGVQTNCPPQRFIAFLSTLPRLKVLNLSGFNLMSSQSFCNELVQEMGCQLTEFDICSGVLPFDDSNLEAIVECCPNMEVLGLNVTRNITGDPLIRLLDNPRRAALLRVVRLSECSRLSAAFLHAFASKTTNLQWVDLSRTLASVGHLADDIVVQLVVNNGHSLTYLSLRANPAVTDVGIMGVGEYCSELSVLSMSGLCKVTNQCLFCLANHCHNLQHLYLSGCALIDLPAIRYLQDQCLGRVNVYHVVPGYGDSTVVAKNLDTGLYCRVRGCPDINYVE